SQLLGENGRRDRYVTEFELLDTGILDDDRYWDVFIEYAQASPEDVLMLVTVHNRGPETATLHVLPQLWYRNTWSWRGDVAHKPHIETFRDGALRAVHHDLGTHYFYHDADAKLLLTENETNVRR